jgi:hypothetical protein
MKTRRALLVFLLAVSACSQRPVTYVAVPEGEFRTEKTKSDRIKLPLNAESREKLLKFLKAGGDANNVGLNIVDPQAEAHYSALLAALADPNNLALENLTSRQTFKRWFPKPPIRQVVDAREEAPAILEPVAVSDGKYWWIFYQHQKRLTELLVVKAVQASMKR